MKRCSGSSSATGRPMRRRYTSSPRHIIQVDFSPYLVTLRQGARSEDSGAQARLDCQGAPSGSGGLHQSRTVRNNEASPVHKKTHEPVARSSVRDTSRGCLSARDRPGRNAGPRRSLDDRQHGSRQSQRFAGNLDRPGRLASPATPALAVSVAGYGSPLGELGRGGMGGPLQDVTSSSTTSLPSRWCSTPATPGRKNWRDSRSRRKRSRS